MLIQLSIPQKHIMKNKYQTKLSIKFVEQTLTKLRRETDNPKIMFGDFNSPLSTMCRTSRQKINKEIDDLYSTMNQLDLADLHKTLYPTIAANTLFLRASGAFSRIHKISSHRRRLSKLIIKKVKSATYLPSTTRVNVFQSHCDFICSGCIVRRAVSASQSNSILNF